MSVYSVNDFPPLRRLGEAWEVLRAEALQLDPGVLQMDREGMQHEEVLELLLQRRRNGWMQSWGANRARWLNYAYTFSDRLCADLLSDHSHPRTAAILRQLCGIKICGISRFLPQTYLRPHTHPELAEERCLTYHLGLSVPEKWCYLHVDGAFLKHHDGEAIVFDASKEHFAFNFSNHERWVLYMEFFQDRIGWRGA